MRLNINEMDPRPSAGGFVQVQAFSKINLILEVLEKRPDGYHEIKSVMQSLLLHDTVTIRNGGISHAANFQLICSDPSLPTDDRNLVTRCAKYMMQEYGITGPISICLEKHIPVAAGLAGGSSDCAATLLGLNDLFSLNIPLHSTTQVSLMEIGRQFGADVPFCLMANANQINAATQSSITALAEGIGERLTLLPPHPNTWIVLACPDIPVSTADIFGRYKATTLTSSLTPAMIQALTKGDLQSIAANFKNDLTQITAELHPEIQSIINEMINQGAIGTAMSGSGPSVFGYFSNKESAEKAQEKLQSIAGRAFLTHI